MTHLRYVVQKLRSPIFRQRCLVDRAPEPLHLHIASGFAALFGSFRTKAAFDLIPRPQYAYGLLKAADYARSLGLTSVTALEFGVASGAGLMNLAKIARSVTESTGVGIVIAGFDSGAGMPPARDYRDHPELYQEGDFQMNVEALRNALPANVSLVIGGIAETVGSFVRTLSPQSPIGFVAVDVDYYHSTVEALKVLSAPDPSKYLPLTQVYLDDIDLECHNSWCGQYLAIAEFNRAEPLRKIEVDRFLASRRIFKQARWLQKMYQLHVLDHPVRRNVRPINTKRVIANPYLDFEGNRELFHIPLSR